MHWNECVCGSVIGVQSHYGGEATCTEKAVCEYCNAGYGEPVGHKYGEFVSNGNGTHTKTCFNDNTHVITENCAGGEATCTEKAKCLVCLGEYGTLKAHEYTELKSNDVMHWNECVCGDVINEEAHFGGEATCTEKAVCEVCLTEYGTLKAHEYTELKSNDVMHWNECVCGDVTNEEAHFGGEATCTQKAVCQACLTEYGEFASHNWQTEYVVNNFYHWHKCSYCDEITNKAEHTIDNSGYCTICGGENLTTEGVVYEISSGYASVVGYTGTEANVKIAKFYQGVPVRIIRSFAFYAVPFLVSVEIPDSVTTIESQAFYYCGRLIYLVIPSSIQSIEADSIYNGLYSFKKIYYEGDEDDWNNIDINSNNSILNYANLYYYKSDEPTLNPEGTAYDNNYWKYDDNGKRYIWSYCTGEATEGIEYAVSADGTFAEVVGYHGTATSVQIADVYNDLPVKSIGQRAFMDNEYIISVDIPNNVTYIGESAFSSCDQLENVRFSERLVMIDERAFYACENLINLELPSGLKEIGDSAFAFCVRITSLDIPQGMTRLGNSAFDVCTSLNTVVISDSVTEIAASFYNCVSLKEFVVSSDNMTYRSIDGNLYTKDGKVLVQYAVGKTDDEFVLPDTVNTIANCAFYNCEYLKKVVMGDGVVSIGRYAFYQNSSLQEVIWGANLTTIEYSAFYNCNNLVSITIPIHVTTIEAEAFADCGALTIYCEAPSKPSGWSDDWNATNDANNIATVWDCNNNDIAEDGAIYYTIGGIRYRLKDNEAIVVEQAMKAIRGYVSIPRSVYYDGKTYVVTSIEENAFSANHLIGTVIIPSSVNSIGASAFSYCSNLKTIVIGDYYHSSKCIIGESAFEGCVRLSTVYFEKDIELVDCDVYDNIFKDCVSLTNFYVSSNVSAYKSIGGHLYTKDGKTLVQYALGNTAAEFIVPDGVTMIKIGAFANCYDLERVVIPDSVTVIGEDAFYNCSSLTTAILVNGVTTIGEYAFAYCGNLTSVVIPDSVTVIGDYAFYGCGNLSYTIKDGLKYYGNANNPYFYLVGVESKEMEAALIDSNCRIIADRAFENCSNLINVSIPDSVIMVGENAFDNCTSLIYNVKDGLRYLGNANNPYLYLVGAENKEIEIAVLDVNCKFIGSEAFYNCENLKSVTIPDGVVSIGSSAFLWCDELTSIVLPNSVLKIGDRAFWSCRGLRDLVIGDGVISIGDDVFYNCPSLENITVSDNNTVYQSIDGNLYNKDGTVLIRYASGKSVTEFVIPDSVVVIEEEAFADARALWKIIIPETVLVIKYSAFAWCDNVTFYCEVEMKPSGWTSSWNSNNRPVYWNYLAVSGDGSDFDNAIEAQCGGYDVVIDEVGEMVYFKFTAAESRIYTIESSNNSGDTYGHLYDASHLEIASDDDSAGNGNNFRITYTLTAGEIYYIAVHFYFNDTGTFTLSIQ